MVVVFLAGCSITADLSALVSAGGQVSGSAAASWVYLRTSCGGGSQTHQGAVPMTGTLSSTQFQLRIPIGPGMGLPVVVPLTTSTKAHVEGTDSSGAPQRTYTIDLACSDC